MTTLPAVRFASLVHKYGVAVPKRDDWDVAMLIANAHHGQLRLADLFSQQQEGRTVIPKLAFIATTFTGRWDVRDLMWLSFVVCIATVGGILWLLLRSELSPRANAICLIIASALVFTPAQDEVIGFAFGFPSFLPAFFIVAALIALRANIATPTKFIAAMMLATASSFTLPHGLLAWGLTWPVIFVLEPKQFGWKWAAGWGLASAACAVVYFHGYAKPADLPAFAPKTSVSEYALFVIGFVGAASARATEAHIETAAMVGAVLVAVFASAAVAVYRTRDQRLWRNAVPWVSLGLYSLGSGILAALGRVAFGLTWCISSRYVPFSIFVAIADAVLLALLIEQRKRNTYALTPILWASVALATILYVRSARDSVDNLRLNSARDRLGRAALQLDRVLDTSRVIDRVLYPHGGSVREYARLLDGPGLLRPQLLRSSRLDLLNHKTADGAAAAGYWETTQRRGMGHYCASGWAALPRKSRPADCVVLGYSTRAGECTAFAMSDAIWRRRDVAEHFGSPGKPYAEQLWSGWSVDFTSAAVPPGAKISAWAMDTDDLKFYRIGQVANAAQL